jgi:transcriptional regulator with XRE-family HTH domain
MISKQLRQAIQDSGETMYAVAMGSGLSFPVVSRFVHGQRDIRLETADALCEYLGLRLTDRKPKRRAAKRKAKR